MIAQGEFNKRKLCKMQMQRTRLWKIGNRIKRLAFTLPPLIFILANSLSAQTVMDELAGTRQRLSMSCAAMMIAASQGPDAVGRHLTDQLNNNLDLARTGESNAQFLMRFFDFHAALAGLVAGGQQSKAALDGAHRASFLLAELSSYGDTVSLHRIAEACVLTFRASS